MSDIIAHILTMSGGDSSVSPLPISLGVHWIVPEPVVSQQQGDCAVFLDPSLNRPQMEADLRAQVAACVTDVTGTLFTASDVRGIGV